MATNTNPFYTYSATAGSSKTLQKPQDGGDNNQWGNYINTDLDEIVAAVNALSDKIADASENTLVDFTATTDAVNHVGVTNAATGNPPQISSAGSDTNVDLTLTAKGTGDINLTPGTNGDVNIPASKGVTFGDDGEKIEGDGTDLTIASSNDLNLTATTDINVPADVGLTFGNDGEKIEGDGTDLTIASSATLNVNTGSASGNDLKVNTSQLVVEGDTGNVGIGTDAPATQASANTFLEIKKASGIAGLGLNGGGSSRFELISDTGDDFKILRNGSEKFKIDGSTSDATLTSGNLVIGTAGQGITFGGDPDSRTGTEGDRTLYDYEEGSFTCGISASNTSGAAPSTTSQYGTYTKIGNIVHAQFLWIGDTTSSGYSGHLYITGLPFESNSSEGRSVGTCAISNLNYPNANGWVVPFLGSGNDFMTLLNSRDDNSYTTVQFTNESWNIYGSITYRV